jgi:hypothetical protein
LVTLYPISIVLSPFIKDSMELDYIIEMERKI